MSIAEVRSLLDFVFHKVLKCFDVSNEINSKLFKLILYIITKIHILPHSSALNTGNSWMRDKRIQNLQDGRIYDKAGILL